MIPGVYRHYKGGYYLGLFTARSSENRDEELVIYFSIRKRTFWVRPLRRPNLTWTLDCWNDQVPWPDGERRQRFVYSWLNTVIIAATITATVLTILLKNL